MTAFNQSIREIPINPLDGQTEFLMLPDEFEILDFLTIDNRAYVAVTGNFDKSLVNVEFEYFVARSDRVLPEADPMQKIYRSYLGRVEHLQNNFYVFKYTEYQT